MTGAQTILLMSVEDGAMQSLAAGTVTGEMGDECPGGDAPSKKEQTLGPQTLVVAWGRDLAL